MRRAATFAPLAFIAPFLACGGLVAPPDETRASDAAGPSGAASSLPDAVAPVPTFSVPDASPIPPPPPLGLFDASVSPCVAAGGTCLELIPCDGELVDLACGWSAGCCMPTGYDAGTCPASMPAPGAPCDAPLSCLYQGCELARCADGGWSTGAIPCPPPPPGH
jgi:hypothetical protein